MQRRVGARAPSYTEAPVLQSQGRVGCALPPSHRQQCGRARGEWGARSLPHAAVCHRRVQPAANKLDVHNHNPNVCTDDNFNVKDRHNYIMFAAEGFLMAYNETKNYVGA